MNDKLKELTNKIYAEGIEKAEIKAEEIISKAENEASAILEKARKDAKEIAEKSQKEAEDLKRNTESEIKLSARQAINALKQDITSLIITTISEEEVKNALNDKDFVKGIISKILTSRTQNDSSGIDLTLSLPDKDREDLDKYFTAKHKELLDKGLSLNFSDKINAGFEIGPKDKSYKISFTDENFESFFKSYLRPRSIKLLYGEKD